MEVSHYLCALWGYAVGILTMAVINRVAGLELITSDKEEEERE